MGSTTIELRAVRRGERVLLLSPAVGAFTAGRGKGEVLGPGESAGVLDILGRPHGLVVPNGVAGRIVNARPELVHAPVDWESVLYELEPLGAASDSAVSTPEVTADAAGLVLRSPQSGRFWHRPSPGDPAFAEAGTEVRPGLPVGLIEVMKTFTHVVYQAEGGLPAKGRVVRMLVQDGGEVNAGDPLLEVEAG